MRTSVLIFEDLEGENLPLILWQQLNPKKISLEKLTCGFHAKNTPYHIHLLTLYLQFVLRILTITWSIKKSALTVVCKTL